MRYSVNGNLITEQIADPVVIVEPTVEPVSTEEMKLHLRVDDDLTADDAMIDSLTTAARQYVEKATGLALIDQTLELRLDGYPAQRAIRLRGPLLEIVSFKYTDEDGDLQDIDADSYVIEASAKNRAPRIVQPYTVTWPYAVPNSDSIRVRWRAGFVDRTGSPTEALTLVPGPLVSAIKLHVEAHYDRDERTFDMLMKAVESLISPYRVSFGVA